MALARTTTNILLPILIFPALSAFAATYIFQHLFNSGLADTLNSQCPKTLVTSETLGTTQTIYPYRLRYTGTDALDAQLCGFVAFFQYAIQPNDAEPLPRLFLTYFIASGLPMLSFLAVETLRYRLSVEATGKRAKNILLSRFSVLGAIYQIVTVGVTIPIYWMFFVLSRTSSPSRKNTSYRSVLTRKHAEAVAFGVLIGGIIPSFGLIVLNDPHVSAIWQFFPFLVSVFKYLHLAIRSPRSSKKTNDTNDALDVVCLLYLLTAIIASSVHVSTVWPRLILQLSGKLERESLAALFIPARLYGSAWPTPSGLVLEFLQWDALFACAASVLATFWLAMDGYAEGGGWKTASRVACWHALAIPLVGPGASIAGVAIWRETRL
ncbi:hypothetical protein AX17_003031 [Amanita inopinata Kibby_2008]|nr:hypothetical protein AX17_003031 [Amanita inopinata Kibby_2008]